MPVRSDQIAFEGGDDDGAIGRIDPANNLRNYTMAWHVWDDYPYKRANIIEGKDEKNGFGPPSYTMFAEGEEVRRAFLLTDSFELAAAGAARISDPDQVKDDIATFHEEHFGQEQENGAAKHPYETHLPELINYIEVNTTGKDIPKYLQASDLAGHLGVSASKAELILRHYFKGIRNEQRRGYPTQFLIDYIGGMTDD